MWVNPPRAKLYTFTPLSTRASYAELAVSVRLPPHPSRTKWTRRVPHPVLIGHTASLSQVHVSLQDGARALFAAAHHDYRRAFRYAGEA